MKRLVYLGGLGSGKNLSPHLRSRQEVGRILRESGVPTIEFRASIIIGSGSASYEMIRALAKTGGVVLSGDLYHYPEELTLKVVPSFDFNKEQTAKSREAIEDFVKKNKAQLWIQHDIIGNLNLKKSPLYYE